MKNTDRDMVNEENTGGYFLCHCECGHIFSSGSANGGGAIADTGDYDDISCPECRAIDPPDADDVNVVWNFQQRRIRKLEEELAALKQDQKGNSNE